MTYKHRYYRRLGILCWLLAMLILAAPYAGLLIQSLSPPRTNIFVHFAFATPFLFAAIWLSIKIKTFPKPAPEICEHCGYQKGTTTLRCPECGKP